MLIRLSRNRLTLIFYQVLADNFNHPAKANSLSSRIDPRNLEDDYRTCMDNLVNGTCPFACRLKPVVLSQNY